MIEWCASSYFSFLEGATSPAELIEHAHKLGYHGLALADRMGQYGQVQALKARNELKEGAAEFFFAPGIRLHFDIADPLLIYPLHKAAHAALCKHLSHWALAGMSHQEKGLTPLPWQDFKNFLRAQSKEQPLAEQFILIAVNGRFFPWVQKHTPTRPSTQKTKKLESSRLQAREAVAPTPSFANPPTAPGFCPLWLLELAQLCGRGLQSALSLAYPLTQSPGSEDLILWLEEQSRALEIPLVATTLPLYASCEDQNLCDLLSSIRHTCPLKNLGYLAQANGERRLLTADERAFHQQKILKRRLEGCLFQDPFEHSRLLARRHRFSLSELTYHYPIENIPSDHNSSSWLRALVTEGARTRYPDGIPEKVSRQLEHELTLVEQLKFEDYFLTIWDILRYAKAQKILFQGRGSAANSIICYCLGITAIDPVQMDLLFERFLSLERHEPPDIDVDFEHERREEVMQEVYRRYGRDRAAMVASVICFRSRMALRECAKALGLSKETQDALVSFMGREGMKRVLGNETLPTELAQLLASHKISRRTWQRLCELAPKLTGIPRHLGLHTGGFILASEPLIEQCVLEPARMENRTLVPWDKDDVAYLHWMKVDLLSLGMLTALRKTFAAIQESKAAELSLAAQTPTPELSLARIPHNCPLVYTHLCRADTVGVFQIESRAQMSMLPRFAPKNFYDIVIEVAIVRPGPLQGGMVHPYLRRRQGLEAVFYDHPDLQPILSKTLGIPIFQEQVMKMVVAVAGFTPGEADQLRKVLSGAWRSKSNMHKLKDKLLNGMKAHGLSAEFAERVYRQIEGFGDYGFPESHAASFALLTYASAYLKYHYPSEFLLGLLNSQPMGFYSPRALIHDAERHGVRVLPIDILHSKWNSTLERNPYDPKKSWLRMGLHLIRGFAQHEALRIEKLQHSGILSPEHEKLPSIDELHQNFGLERRTLEKLIRAGALHRYMPATPGTKAQDIPADDRRGDLWQLLRLKHIDKAQAELDVHPKTASEGFIPRLSAWESLLQDYATSGLTPKSLAGRSEQRHYHPAQFAREEFFVQQRWLRAEDLYSLPDRSRAKIIGLLGAKQKPPTAGGLVFATLEDESGFFNLVLMPDVYEKYRLVLESGALLAAEGEVQRSFQSNPLDPKSVAVSLKVAKLWNPLIPQNGPKHAQPSAKSRNWH